MVIAAASTVAAALAIVIALLGDSPSDPAGGADIQQVRAEVAEARAESEAATAMADAAMVVAQEAAAKAALVEEALAAAPVEPGEAVTPDDIARLEAQLAEVRNLAATALVAADTSVSAEDSPVAGDATADDGAAELEEEPAPEEEPASGAGDASEEEPAAGSASGEEPAAGDDEAVDLPGEPFEHGPSAGAALFVVGLPYDSVLNVRDVPAGEFVGMLDPVNLAGGRAPFVVVRDALGAILAEPELSTAVTATGRARQLPTTVWYQHQAAGVTGWSSAAYLAELGATDDATGQVLAALGETVTDDTMAGLARRVAGVMASEEPPSRVVVTTPGGVVEGVANIGVDVIGLADDSLLGYRLVVTATPAGNWMDEDDPGPYTLTAVGRTAICRRGVSEEGLCN